MLNLLRSSESDRHDAHGTSFRQLRQHIHGRLIGLLDGDDADLLDRADSVRERIGDILAELSDEHGLKLGLAERDRLESEIIEDLGGMGPLASLMLDRRITDILINGAEEIWVDRCGQLEKTELRFDDEPHLRRFVDRVIALQGRQLDARHPMVDARLPDGSRLHAVIPPLCPRGTVVSIRRFHNETLSADDLVTRGMLDAEMLAVLALAVRSGQNIVIAGGAGSGKTTLLNALSRYVPAGERIITVEETAELKLSHPHVIPLETRPGNAEGQGQVSLRELVRTALRMRADRIIVGEVRGEEVLDMLQAMNVGHDGSLTTVHANSPQDVLRRLEALAHMGDAALPRESIRDIIASAVQLVVQVMRFGNGQRRIVSLCEVHECDGQLRTRELHRFRCHGHDEQGFPLGTHESCGVSPQFMRQAATMGYTLQVSTPTEPRRVA